MNFKISPKFTLQIGLSAIFIYAGLSSIFNPADWLGFIPSWIEKIMSREIFLTLHSIFELILGAALLFDIIPKIASFIAFLDLTAILLFYGIDDVTFRDFGLLMMALALFLSNKKLRANS